MILVHRGRFPMELRDGDAEVPAAGGRGLGATLLEFLIERAREAEATSLQARTQTR